MTDERIFILPNHREIKQGEVTDIYFVRTKEILEKDGLEDAVVAAEFTVSSLPKNYSWFVFAGIREIIKVLEGLPVDLYSVPEGTILTPRDINGVRTPVMLIVGPYSKFVVYETTILGFLAAATGYATKAARLRKLAGDKPIINFGARRTHPAIAPFCDFYSYIGGFDAVSCILGAKILGKKPVGTMPHSLLIMYRALRGDHSKGWIAFDRYMPNDVPRIMLCDTFSDEVEETLNAVRAVGKERIYGVRLDTPGSRKGSFPDIIREVKWKLRQEGYGDVKIFVSGGVNEDNIRGLVEAGADGFGIGSAVANAPFVDFAMDIVAVKVDDEWMYISKRGKYSGIKKVWRKIQDRKLLITTTFWDESPGEEWEQLLVKYIENGEIVRSIVSPDDVRSYVLRQLSEIALEI